MYIKCLTGDSMPGSKYNFYLLCMDFSVNFVVVIVRNISVSYSGHDFMVAMILYCPRLA